MLNNLAGQAGELRMTLQITRKATGKTETVELVSRTTPEQHTQIMKELNKGNDDGCHAFDGK